MNLTIVGLGSVGTSVGLALKDVMAKEIRVMGHDPDADKVKRAKRIGAIDKSHWNLISACEKADLILLDLSLTEMEQTLDALRDSVKEGVLMVDTAAVKRPVLDLAQRLLPETVQFVGGHVVSPQLAMAGDPSAEFLNGAVFYLVAPETVTPEALDTASNLAEAVGATPYYIDAAEHDGLMAAVSQLPLLSALAMVGVLKKGPGSKERAQAVGREFAAVGSLLADEPIPSAEAFLANAENLLRWLDACALELDALRTLISEGDQEALEERIAEAREASREWMGQGASKMEMTEVRGSDWRSMFLGNLGRRRSQ